MVLTKLQEAMDKKGISNEELAAKTMMSARSVMNAKKGKGVSLGSAKRMAAGLKMKLEELQ